MELTLTRTRRDLTGSHTAKIIRVEEVSRSRVRVSFELETTPPAVVRRDYPLSLYPTSALYALLSGLQLIKSEITSVDLAKLVGVKARVQVTRRIVATKLFVTSAVRCR